MGFFINQTTGGSCWNKDLFKEDRDLFRIPGELAAEKEWGKGNDQDSFHGYDF